MMHSRSSHPECQVPYVLIFLAEAIVSLGGLTTEGIFRVPGDADSVAELKARLDRGYYHLVGFLVLDTRYEIADVKSMMAGMIYRKVSMTRIS